MMVPLQHSMHFIKLKEFNNPRNQVETSGFNLQKKRLKRLIICLKSVTESDLIKIRKGFEVLFMLPEEAIKKVMDAYYHFDCFFRQHK